MEILQVGSLEWNGSAEHGEQENAERPDVHEETFVSFVNNDFRSQISWSSTLFLDHLSFFYDFWNSKIAYFDTFFAVEKDIVKFDVSMDDGPAMNMRKPISNLLKNEFSIWFLQFTFSFNESKQITSTGIFHHHQKMLTRLKDFE